jgi:hypothetical protein
MLSTLAQNAALLGPMIIFDRLALGVIGCLAGGQVGKDRDVTSFDQDFTCRYAAGYGRV